MSLTTLDGDVASDDISLTASNEVTQRTPFFVLIDSELIHVSLISTDTWTITRGAYSTTPAAHTDTTAVYLVESVVPTAQGVNLLYIDDTGKQVSKFIQTYQTPGGGSQPIQPVSIAVTSAEILALFSAPLQIVAAPGAGKAIMLVAACGSLSAGTSYTVADGVYLGSAAGVIGDFGTGFRLANLSNALVNPAPNVAFDPLAGVGSQTSDWDNQPLSLIADVSDPTGGTLDLVLTVLYTVVDL